MKLDAVGCGSMVVDLYHRTPRIIGVDEKILIDSGGSRRAAAVQAVVGGVVLNHLGWARVLGLRTGIFGKIGNDPHGAMLRRGMRRLGIRTDLTRDGSASSFAAIFLDPEGNRAIYMARGATGELTAAEVRRVHGGFIRNAHLVSTEISQLPLPPTLLAFRPCSTLTSRRPTPAPPSAPHRNSNRPCGSPRFSNRPRRRPANSSTAVRSVIPWNSQSHSARGLDPAP
jgi:hypothetical protein